MLDIVSGVARIINDVGSVEERERKRKRKREREREWEW